MGKRESVQGMIVLTPQQRKHLALLGVRTAGCGEVGRQKPFLKGHNWMNGDLDEDGIRKAKNG